MRKKTTIEVEISDVVKRLLVIEDERTELRRRIMDYVKKYGEIKTDDFTVTYRGESAWDGLDRKYIREHYPNVYKEAYTGTFQRPEYIAITRK